ncbi:MAG: class I SAM-dependent methyltransferase [Anaerolineae bacterium]|nr:class I SAM-dependent methyltransferase [Anaerolineae bacterium]
MSEWRRFIGLARQRAESPEAYRRFQAQQGRMVLQRLEAQGVSVAGRRVLDLGCGLGGYTEALRERGARVVATDLSLPALVGLPPLSPRVCADALALPFSDAAFDLVFCASLIEHVPDGLALLEETRRVVRPGGYGYVSFPPFYSPRGGHQFAPYHLLGERFATWLYLRTRARRIPAWQRDIVAEGDSYSRAYHGFGLHRVTIAAAKRWAAQAGWQVVSLSTRFSPVNTAKWPLLGEFLTWHAEFLLRKPA